MGVKDLWNIVSPLSERKPIFELQGKAVAIDLSGWVVDSQSVTDNVVQPKMYLRNLFFRTAFLLMLEISPVFVLEGTAPSLKHKTIARRNEIRNGPPEKKTNRKGGRSNFNRILKECEEMLKYMGISCVRGNGEAEAMCAYLNAEGLVEGCISQDSDCFLYGARKVYRNFCTSSQGNRGTSSGSIDEYAIEKIERVFGLGRNKMIALALLCGCDYDDGINGVGKEAALKLFKLVSDDQILKRIKSWRTDSSFEEIEAELSNPNICTTCGHQGKMRSHLKSGCRTCGTVTKCKDDYKEKRILISNEISIRKKALLVEDFPSQELIDEFLYNKDPMPSSLDLQWKQPQILKFVNFMERHLAWETEYAYAKVLTLLTRWQVRHLAGIPDDRRLSISNLLIPEKIKKPRNIKGVASYEIVWKDEKGLFEGMTLACISDKENDSEDSPATPTELATLEPQHLVLECYPYLVQEFEAAKLAKKKKPVKPRGKKAKPAEDGSEEKKEERKKAQRRPRKPRAETAKNRKIDEFVKTSTPTFEESFEALTITPKRKKKNIDETEEINRLIASGVKKRGPQFDRVQEIERLNKILNGSLLRMFNELTPEDFPSDNDDMEVSDMSEIINELCNRSKAINLSLGDNESMADENDLGSHIRENYRENAEIIIKPKLILKNKRENVKETINSEFHQKCSTIQDSKKESECLDCTLGRIIAARKNVVDHKEKVFSIMNSPNVFAKTKESRGKFDLLNFTFERKYSMEPTSNHKISDDIIQKSANNFDNSEFKTLDPNGSVEEMDLVNSFSERVRFAQYPDTDFKSFEDSIQKSNNVFNISNFKLQENEAIDQAELANSTSERLQIVQKSEDGDRNRVDNIKKSVNQDKNTNDNFQKSEDSHKNTEGVQQRKNILDCARLIIPEENEFTDESDLFDSTIEYSRNLQSPGVDCGRKGNSSRKSIGVIFEGSKLKIPQENESIDEFDIITSAYVPLHERLVELQKPEIMRTSTPDLKVVPNGKKFSFGIDNLLNDTDL